MGVEADPARWGERIGAGDRRALARALTHIENQTDEAEALIDAVSPRLGVARRIGITGPPGAGKSSLIEQIVLLYRQCGHSVGVVAVDPTSAITGGALLGDRVRMSRLAGDDGVFVRSMASRGRLGGLAPTTNAAADLLDAAGFERVLIETVGVGQIDLEVAEAADVVVVVLVPEAGDGIQGMKAGLIEIADILVVNKADRDGAPDLARALSEALELRSGDQSPVPVLLTSAKLEDGIAALWTAIEATAAQMRESGALMRKRRHALRRRLRDELTAALLDRLDRSIGLDRALDALCDEVMAGRSTPRRAVARLLAEHGLA